MSHIILKDVCRAYGTRDKTVEVLRGVNLEIERGETVAIVGASGAGKSTLLNVMGALDRPTSGEVFFSGESVSAMDDSRLAAFRNSTVGFVFQFHHLLPEFTALENVMLPALIGGCDRADAGKRSKELLSEVGLGQRLTHKPGELSGGEQQRCAIVRSLVCTPEVILADEPTGNLDARTGDDVFKLLLDFNREKNISLVVVTHNEALAARMSRRLEMVDGRLMDVTTEKASAKATEKTTLH